MRTRPSSKLVRDGSYVVEIPVELIEDETSWSPYLSLDDAQNLDSARRALRAGDLAAAARYGKLFELRQLSA